MKHKLLNALACLVVLPLTLHAVSVGDYQVSQNTSASGSIPIWAVRVVTPAPSVYSLAGFDTTKTPGNFTFGTGITISGTGPNYTISATESPGGATWGDITGTLSNQTDLQTALSAKQPLATNLTSLAGLTYSSLGFVKMSGAGTFTLDTTIYAPATSGASGSVLYALNPANTTTANLDSITATASTDLTLNAGSGNQNVWLNGTGTGSVLASVNVTPYAPVVQGFAFVGQDGALAYIVDQSFGGSPYFRTERTDGTNASPSAIANGDIIGSFSMSGFNGTSYPSATAAGISGQAAENWSTSANGAEIYFDTTPRTTTTNHISLIISPEGRLEPEPASSSIAAWGVAGYGLEMFAATATDSTSTGTVANAVYASFASPTFAAANAGVTYTDAANVYIASGPTAGANVTITNRHALEVVGSISTTSPITGLVVIASALGTSATSIGLGAGNINAGGSITGNTLVSTVATGTAPLTVTSNTNVANLNASSLSGATFASPGAIGGTSASAGTFTALKASTSAAALGFATGGGAGGAVTQLTSRTTGVTVNTPTGAITLFAAAGSATPATFTVTDSAVAATDVIKVVEKSGSNLYETFVTAVAAGSFNITFFTTGGTTSDSAVFNFVVLKGSAT